MPGKYITGLKTARQAAYMTQEQAAEAADVSLESWKAYEYGDRLPPAETAKRICEALDAPWLKLEYAQLFTDALGILPQGIQAVGMPVAVLNLIDKASELSDAYRRLVQIAADGRIDESEEPDFEGIKGVILDVIAAGYQVIYTQDIPEPPEFDDIVRDLDGIVGAALQVKFTPGIKKGRLDVGASKRQDLRLASEIDRKNNIPHMRAGRKHNFAREGGALL